MNGYAESILRLPGTPEEKVWLEKRLEVLSAKEEIILPAAAAFSQPETMTDAINRLLTLNDYDIYPANSYESLGEYYLWAKCVPQDQQQFFDKDALGQWYEDEHPGLFVGSWYVAYPKHGPAMPYDGEHLPADTESLDWSVRLKLASDAVPDGVWLKLPDYQDINDGKPDEIRIALDELRVETIQECTLLEARCVLPCVQDLAGQYDNLADLIYDGQNLGFILDERGQGSPGYLDKFFAVLEHESCQRLSDAVNIAGELQNYDVISVDTFLDNAMQKLSGQEWAKGGEGAKNCFDYVAYATALAEQQGYQMTDDSQYYIRKRDSPELEQQPTGMTMQ